MDLCLFAERGCTAELGRGELLCFMAAPCAAEARTRIDQIVKAAEDLGRSASWRSRQEFTARFSARKSADP